MKLRHMAFAFIALPFAAAVLAEEVTCPDLAMAVQVGTCPSEEELQFTFSGYCSDNARMYEWQEEQVCTNYPLYRQLKNVVLWEAKGGDYQGYVSCDLPREQVVAAKPVKIAVGVKGKLTRVVCSYSGGISFAYRTKAKCKVEGSGDCAADPAGCKASCN